MADQKIADENSGQAKDSEKKKDLEAIAEPPKGYWEAIKELGKAFFETVKYFGRGLSAFQSFLVIVALIMLVATIMIIYWGGQTYAFLAFGIFVLVIIIILIQGQSDQNAEIRKWSEKNQADIYTGKPQLDVDLTNQAFHKTIGGFLEAYRDFVAELLALPKDAVRTNIFRMAEKGVLKIPPGMHFNMKDEKELTIELPPNEGCTGSAYSLGRPVIATRETSHFPYGVPKPEKKKVNDQLQWIISLPIFAGNEVVGVLNADGVDTRKTKQELRTKIPSIHPWADLAGKFL